MEQGCLNKNSLGGDVKGFAVIGGDVTGGRSAIGEGVTGALVTFQNTIKSKRATRKCKIMTSLTAAQWLATSYQVVPSLEGL